MILCILEILVDVRYTRGRGKSNVCSKPRGVSNEKPSLASHLSSVIHDITSDEEKGFDSDNVIDNNPSAKI
jgi:hypothetical protein